MPKVKYLKLNNLKMNIYIVSCKTTGQEIYVYALR